MQWFIEILASSSLSLDESMKFDVLAFAKECLFDSKGLVSLEKLWKNETTEFTQDFIKIKY